MYTYFSRFSHHTLSQSDAKSQNASILSYSGLTRISRLNKFANLFDLDTPIKSECDSLCAGRSMVEMLGVLAIIGVLSVGAIAGYSKAMMKYRLNKQAEQLSTIINAVAIYGMQIKAPKIEHVQIDLLPTLNKLNYIPKEMLKANDQKYAYDVFNTRIYPLSGYNSDWVSPNGHYTGIDIILDSGKSARDIQICQNILNTTKESHDSVWYIELTSVNGNGATTTVYEYYHGDKYCTDKCLKDLTVSKMNEFCSSIVGDANDGEHFAVRVWWR